MSATPRVTRPATDSWFDQLEELTESQALQSARLHVRHGQPVDQAQGLRKLFTSPTMRCIAVVSNPSMAFGGLLLERLCSAYIEQGLRVLIVDAGEHARAPAELAGFDLSEGIEVLGPQVNYLASRGLALRYVDTSGSTSGFLDALVEAAPDTDVLLMHASASELARTFARRIHELQATTLRPLVLCDEQPESVTHAYAAIKLLSMRAGLMAHDLLICAPQDSPRAVLLAERVARCADDFLGAVLHDWVIVDPAETSDDPPSLRLRRLAREQLGCALPQPLSDSAFAALSADLPSGRRAALPATGARERGVGGGSR
jgi:flagellar biosynthesis protein FlhG